MSSELKLDAAWDSLRSYHTTLRLQVQLWRKFIRQRFVCEHFTADELQSWIDRIGLMNEVLFHQYLYDTKRILSLHPAGSGFPERLHVRVLEAEKSAVVKPLLVETVRLKRAFLDQLFAYGQPNFWMLEQIAKARANELLVKNDCMQLFQIRRFQKIPSLDGVHRYLCCFERYCYRNVPTLYLMLFESSVDDFDEHLMLELMAILREESSHLPKLGVMARKVDEAMACIHPKWLGRVTVGPMFIAGVTQDDHLLQRKVNEQGNNACASRIVYEYVVSSGDAPVSRLRDPQGRSHARLEEFMIQTLDDECEVRKVSGVEKYLIAPHAIVQTLDTAYCREIKHHIVTAEELQ